MYAALKERLEEFLLYISPVGEDLSIKMFGKHAPNSVITIVNVSRCQTESYDLSGVVADEVQLEAVAPSHRAFSTFCKTGKHLVEMPPEVMAHGNHRTVHESDAGTPSERIQAHEQHKFIEYAWHELHKAIVGNGMREITSQLAMDTVEIIFLEGAVSTEMIAYKYGHYLAFRHAPLTVSVPYTVITRPLQNIGKMYL